MSIKKQYFKTKPYCKVTFLLDKTNAQSAQNAYIAADFNKWQPERTPMKALKNGNFSVSLNLEKGHEYQYRFVVDDNTWLTDDSADKTVRCDYGNCRNSVVVV